MMTANKICLIAMMILSWSCFIEEIANYYFLYKEARNRYRMWVFLAIGLMSTFLSVEYFFLKHLL